MGPILYVFAFTFLLTFTLEWTDTVLGKRL